MLTHQVPDPVAISLLILIAFVLSGTMHVLWLRHPLSQPLNIPLDANLTFRGKRIFGDNKTVRGVLVIVPATGISFLLISMLQQYLPSWFSNGIWNATHVTYAFAGILAGLGFILGELPNSFIKRQCNIPSGDVPRRKQWRRVTRITDRIDSILGILLLLSIVMPVPLQTWLYLLILGPAVHSLFSIWLFQLKIKERPG